MIVLFLIFKIIQVIKPSTRPDLKGCNFSQFKTEVKRSYAKAYLEYYNNKGGKNG